MGSPKAGRHTKRLSFANHDISRSCLRLVLTGRFENAERDGFADIRYRERRVLVRNLRNVVRSLDCSKKIRRLNYNGGRVGIELSLQVFQVQAAVGPVVNQLHLDAQVLYIGVDDCPILGMNGPGYQKLVLSRDALAHQHGFR